MKTSIYIDVNNEIGYGHLMRTQLIADELINRGHDVCYICEFAESIKTISNGGHKAVLRQTYMDSEEVGHLLIIDKYNCDESKLELLSKRFKVNAQIDDNGDVYNQVNIIINGNIHADLLGYEDIKGKTVLIGLEYNLVNPIFKKTSHIQKKELKRIVVTTGGGDSTFFVKRFIELFGELISQGDKQYSFIIGPGVINKDCYEHYQMKNISFIHNPTCIAEVFLDSDLVLSSGGTTLYELCAMGVPSISMITADNQRESVERFNSLGIIDSIGADNPINWKLWCNLLQKYESMNIRVEQSNKMKQLIDGSGIIRIANLLEKVAMEGNDD